MRGLIHHLDLTVRDVAVSAPFYEAVLGFMGYRRERAQVDGIDWDRDLPGAFCSIGIKPARSDATHDRYTPGLHHVAWAVESRADVDRLHAELIRVGATVLDAPADYPHYGTGYYAVFFADPDGLKFEYVHMPGQTSANHQEAAP